MKISDILFVTDYSSYYLFKDLYNRLDINKCMFKKTDNRMVDIFRKIHTNKKISKYVYIPFRDIWFPYNEIRKKIKDNGVLLTNSMAMSMPTINFWIKLRKEYPHTKFVLLLVDPMHAKSGHMVEVRKRLKTIKWDLVLSYDKYDCEEYGFEYIGLNYYSKYSGIKPSNNTSDLYYISSVKTGRSELLRKIFKRSKVAGIISLFKIYSLWRNVDYGKPIRRIQPYEDVVADILSTNCILEILQDGQKSQSLRYLEALAYNKKLLSNNPNLNKLPGYDARYMKYFEKVDDVDWNWVKKKENIHFKLHRDFSSANIISILTKVLEK